MRRTVFYILGCGVKSSGLFSACKAKLFGCTLKKIFFFSSVQISKSLLNPKEKKNLSLQQEHQWRGQKMFITAASSTCAAVYSFDIFPADHWFSQWSAGQWANFRCIFALRLTCIQTIHWRIIRIFAYSLIHVASPCSRCVNTFIVHDSCAFCR